MKGILVVAFGVGMLLDFFIVIVGIGIILKADSALTYVISVAIAIVLTCLRLCMEPIFRHGSKMYLCLRVIFIVCVFVSLLATANTFLTHVLTKNRLFTPAIVDWNEVLAASTFQIKATLTIIALLLAISPMFISHLAQEYAENEEDEESEMPISAKAASKEDRKSPNIAEVAGKK